MNIGSLRLVSLMVCMGGCTSTQEAERMPATAILSQPPVPPTSTPSPEPTAAVPTGKAATANASPPNVTAAQNPIATVPDQQTVARARTLVETAQKHYHAGAYDKAEVALKEAISLYPFLADANLLLGKVFLLKGSALRDVGMVASARLMFEMAHNIDPSMREAELLLDLFKREPGREP